MNTTNDSAKDMVDRAKSIIATYFPKKTYRIVWEQRDGSLPGTDLIIYNKTMNQSRDSACIQCELYDEQPSILHIESLKQCGLQGRTLLNQLIDFSKKCGFLQLTLQDGSRIVYTANGDEASISLKKLRRLMTGQGWYETFGFTNETIVAYQEDIKRYLQQPIGIYSDELIYRIQDYLEDNTHNITRGRTISATVSGLYTVLTTECPARVCPNEDDLAVVDEIDNIVEELYQGMLTSLRLNDTDFTSLTLTFPLKQKGSSRTRRKRARKARATHRRRTRHV